MIMAVLAITGITYFRQHALASKVTEAQAMVQSIRAAEERYRAENRAYLNVTITMPTTGADRRYYPAPPDGKGTRRSFFLPSTDVGQLNVLWRVLNPTTSGPVQFGYAVVAGAAGATLPTMQLTNQPTWPATTDSWYVIQAAANNDNDSVYCVVAGTSFNGEVYVENEGE
jgi:type IV pilus assembly protein PilA